MRISEYADSSFFSVLCYVGIEGVSRAEVEAGGEDMEEGVSTEEVEGVAGRAGGTIRGDDDIANDLFSQGRWL